MENSRARKFKQVVYCLCLRKGAATHRHAERPVQSGTCGSRARLTILGNVGSGRRRTRPVQTNQKADARSMSGTLIVTKPSFQGHVRICADFADRGTMPILANAGGHGIENPHARYPRWRRSP